MRRTIDITDFLFAPSGYGHYRVTYTSPVTGKKWHATLNDMSLIDDTKNSDFPKKCDLIRLRSRVKFF
jgi:hypothetical protein